MDQEQHAQTRAPGGSAPPDPSSVEEITLRLGGAGDEAAIQDLFEATFGVRRSAEEWRWRFLEAPLKPRIHLLELSGHLVGHVAFARFSTFLDGVRDELGSAGDWMYRPEVRGKGATRKLYAAYGSYYSNIPVTLGFPSPVAQAVRERSPDDNDPPLFELPQWVRWHTGPAVRESNPKIPVFAGTMAVAGTSLLAEITRRATFQKRYVERRWASNTDLDALAERLRHVARCVRVRDGAYVDWRWHRQPDRAWWMHTCADRTGRLTGWAVAGLDPTTPGTGRVVDLLAEDAATTTALLDAAHRALGAAGAELSSCELLDQRPWARAAIQRAGFLHRPGGPLARARQPGTANTGWTEPTSWYLTRGDTDFA